MSKKNKGTKNNNEANDSMNAQSTQRMDDNSKKYKSGGQNNAQNSSRKEGK